MMCLIISGNLGLLENGASFFFWFIFLIFRYLFKLLVIAPHPLLYFKKVAPLFGSVAPQQCKFKQKKTKKKKDRRTDSNTKEREANRGTDRGGRKIVSAAEMAPRAPS